MVLILIFAEVLGLYGLVSPARADPRPAAPPGLLDSFLLPRLARGPPLTPTNLNVCK